MTRVFNDPVDFAEQAIDGFVAANSVHVARVDGGVVRSTVTPQGNVAVVIGGGSGHYPAFAGLVGPGLASAAVCGNIFASPAASQVRRVATLADSGGGVLLLYGNYAGDVLHFGQAQDELRKDGIDVRTVLVTDDIASSPATASGQRRGVAGDLAVFKVAGAAAEEGATLDEVERLARKANDYTRSLGIAFASPTLPGARKPLFAVPQGKFSLGLGIHGEPGISDHDLCSARELAALLVETLLRERPEGAQGRVVPILNGLGAVKYEELFVLYNEIMPLLEQHGLTVVAPEVGEFVSSLDMAGLSLTLLWLDEEIERLWLAPADTPAFRRGNAAARERIDPASLHRAIEQIQHEAVSQGGVRRGQQAAAMLETIRSVIETNESEFGRLDSLAGDGDHGIGMRRGVESAVRSARTSAATGHGFTQLMELAADAWSERAGGTSGAIWRSILQAIGRTIGNEKHVDTPALAAAATAALEAVQELGKAEVGDKTMVDVLEPVARSLKESALADVGPGSALERAARVATASAQATSEMLPRKGRARPLAEKSLGHPDPGAISLAVIIRRVVDEFVK